ncbi:hypothetical protein BJ875DRAFT_441795 [Amylocarpus encephaloides]|uniref:CCHC-type domain-containing protein n=1 Tax=Amylocarpus encephaloides TaxID=45428 RepID=A0A9P7YIY1_9HELO|nr:hypothetical protein BJ875DRAFT_441795 [Amylocarpus encephaloides]
MKWGGAGQGVNGIVYYAVLVVEATFSGEPEVVLDENDPEIICQNTAMGEDMEDGDSRTSQVGRKRELRDVAQFREPSAVDASSDEEPFEPSRKHLKQDKRTYVLDETSVSVPAETAALTVYPTTSEDGIATGVSNTESSQKIAPSPEPQVDSIVHEPSPRIPKQEVSIVGTNLQESTSGSTATVVLPTSDAPSPATGSLPSAARQDIQSPSEASNLASDETASASKEEGSVASLLGWNQGVQPGLRTSFGKKKSRTRTKLEKGSKSSQSQLGHSFSADALVNTKDNSAAGLNSSSSISQPVTSQIIAEKTAPSQNDDSTNKSIEVMSNEAELQLNSTRTWPLPDGDEVAKTIQNGKTFYPSYPPPENWKGLYLTGGYFRDPPILDDRGLPYKFQDFSFNIFAPAFLMSNLNRTDNWETGDLRHAFRQYIAFWYGHLPAIGLSLTSLGNTCQAPQAFTLKWASKKAMALQKQKTASKTVNNKIKAVPPREKQENPLPSDHLRAVSQTKGSKSDNFDHDMHITRTDGSIEDDSDNYNEMACTSASDVDGNQGANEDFDPAEDPEFQQKYFPGGSSGTRCLSCGGKGHSTTGCSVLDCGNCGAKGTHSSFTCPLKQRCNKCFKRGHQALKCTEKLAATNVEAGNCEICNSGYHLEKDCHFIWRSFTPKEDEVQTVSHIPIHCYTCGGTGHFGPECGLYKRKLLSGGYTWSMENLRKYVDPRSQNRAVSAGVDYSIGESRPRQFSIKGKGKENDPFTMDDSDGEDDFIRPKINKAPTLHGNIQFPATARHQLSVPYENREYHQFQRQYPEDNISYNIASQRENPTGRYHGNMIAPRSVHDAPKQMSGEYPAQQKPERPSRKGRKTRGNSNATAAPLQPPESRKGSKRKSTRGSPPCVSGAATQKHPQAPPNAKKKAKKVKRQAAAANSKN